MRHALHPRILPKRYTDTPSECIYRPFKGPRLELPDRQTTCPGCGGPATWEHYVDPVKSPAPITSVIRCKGKCRPVLSAI